MDSKSLGNIISWQFEKWEKIRSEFANSSSLRDNNTDSRKMEERYIAHRLSYKKWIAETIQNIPPQQIMEFLIVERKRLQDRIYVLNEDGNGFDRKNEEKKLNEIVEPEIRYYEERAKLDLDPSFQAPQKQNLIVLPKGNNALELLHSHKIDLFYLDGDEQVYRSLKSALTESGLIHANVDLSFAFSYTDTNEHINWLGKQASLVYLFHSLYSGKEAKGRSIYDLISKRFRINGRNVAPKKLATSFSNLYNNHLRKGKSKEQLPEYICRIDRIVSHVSKHETKS